MTRGNVVACDDLHHPEMGTIYFQRIFPCCQSKARCSGQTRVSTLLRRNNGSLMIHFQRSFHPRRLLRSLPRTPIKSGSTFGSQHPHQLPHTSPPMAQQSSSSVLKAFDPFACHPFTNNNVLDRCPPPTMPSKYPHPVPTSNQYTAGTPAHMQTPRQSPTNNTIHSPEPRRPITLVNSHQSSNSAQRQPKPIFTPFHQDRYSPELDEILLRKKLTQALGHVALGLDVKQDA